MPTGEVKNSDCPRLHIRSTLERPGRRIGLHARGPFRSTSLNRGNEPWLLRDHIHQRFARN
jgi:hypothetical protein